MICGETSGRSPFGTVMKRSMSTLRSGQTSRIFASKSAGEGVIFCRPNPEYNKNFYTDTWITLYSGTGAAVVLDVTNYSAFWGRIAMYDYSDTLVWSQDQSVPPNGVGHYYVGRNVATVKIRGYNGMGTVHVTVYPAE